MQSRPSSIAAVTVSSGPRRLCHPGAAVKTDARGEGAQGGGVGARWRVPADYRRVEGRAIQGMQGPWSGGDEAREVRVQGLRLLMRPVPDRGERSASVSDEGLGPQVEGGARNGVGGLGRDESAS